MGLVRLGLGGTTSLGSSVSAADSVAGHAQQYQDRADDDDDDPGRPDYGDPVTKTDDE